MATHSLRSMGCARLLRGILYTRIRGRIGGGKMTPEELEALFALLSAYSFRATCYKRPISASIVDMVKAWVIADIAEIKAKALDSTART